MRLPFIVDAFGQSGLPFLRMRSFVVCVFLCPSKCECSEALANGFDPNRMQQTTTTPTSESISDGSCVVLLFSTYTQTGSDEADTQTKWPIRSSLGQYHWKSCMCFARNKMTFENELLVVCLTTNIVVAIRLQLVDRSRSRWL